MADKAILSIGGEQLNTTAEYYCLATATGKNTFDTMDSRFLTDNGGREMCGTTCPAAAD